MPLETVGEEMERLESERRRYELMLAATPESERDRRAHLQEWVDRRTARLDHMHDRRPLGRWFPFTLGSAAVVSAWGSWAVASFWPGMALTGLALFLAVSLRTGFLARLTRKAARKLTRRSHWEKAPRTRL